MAHKPKQEATNGSAAEPPIMARPLSSSLSLGFWRNGRDLPDLSAVALTATSVYICTTTRHALYDSIAFLQLQTQFKQQILCFSNCTHDR
jgi:hypothetical protein